MARYVFRLPDIGEGTAEAELIAWHVAVGDEVAEDAPLADIMTDKATVEMTSPVSGRVAALHGEVGGAVAIGAPLVEFDTEGEDALPAPAEAPSHAVAGGTAPAEKPQLPMKPRSPSRPRAAPAVRHRAAEAHVDLADIRGSGPGGRIRQSDLEAHLAGRKGEAVRPGGAAYPAGAHEEMRITGLRRRIARHMELSSRHIPHFSYVEEFDMTALEEARADLNARYDPEGRPRLTLLPFFIRAIAELIREFPSVNAVFDEAEGVLRRYRDLHVGIATQTDNGLVVPVVRDAGGRDLWDLAAEIARVTTAARDGTAPRELLRGSTITLTSLGRLGGLAATPIINHPEVAIIAPNRIVERPVVIEGDVVVRRMMNLSTSFDHRIVDGYDAARFVQAMKELIEKPTLLLTH